MIFLYLVDGVLYFSPAPLKTGEMLSQFRSQEAADAYCRRHYRGVPIFRSTPKTVEKKSRKKKSPRPFSKEHRERMSMAKRGSRNPMWGGRKEETKKKISRTMRGTRGGQNNPMWGRRHGEATRSRMKEAHRRLGPKRWAVSLTGNKRTWWWIYRALPEGFVWKQDLYPVGPDTP